MSDDAVTVAWIHDGEHVTYSFFWSLMRLMMWDSAHARRLPRGGFVVSKYVTGGIAASRRKLVRDWLASSASPWLMFIDTDMGFPPDGVERLVEVADPVERPVVGGLTFGQLTGEGDGWGGFRPQMWPVLLRWTDEGGVPGFQPWLDYPRDQVVRADATGAAFLLIHRSVFVRLRELHGGGDWSGWFDHLPSPREGADDLSEDFSFCFRLREAGIPLHVYTGVKTTHLKPNWLCEEGYLAARAAQSEPDLHPVGGSA